MIDLTLESFETETAELIDLDAYLLDSTDTESIDELIDLDAYLFEE